MAVGADAARVGVDVPEDLPLVRADAGLLERILANLLDNGLRHGGGGPVEVTATAGDRERQARGRRPRTRRRRGGPRPRCSRRSSGSTTSSGGLGLGLAVAKGFAEAMGGALVADTSPGGGLTMRLRLPLAAAAGAK